ncbi:MAG: hypothetical protein A2622_13595 [Bdellovibrionales bacterium RIFCSPHIGHO2_01_FULL_40_29]|nr:MAG: hypothetical protein A2622_13595 [Bdellovibrionales bacterium RIFCSPHIGHO2_01_FULL_40_29]OFZ34271.1 MAG: hypothetical protein A3D17_04355 [Bdellovibrionales bacterium RIFCSPHIGHO2_02_FULL_40_15]
MRPPPGEFNPILPWLGIGSLIISLFIGIGVTIFIIYNSVHKKIKEADDVISQIQSGNLKARFKIQRRDEFGEAMVRFNKMADEIEKLVDHLKFVELARTKLIQELAHDTKYFTIQNLLQTGIHCLLLGGLRHLSILFFRNFFCQSVSIYK